MTIFGLLMATVALAGCGTPSVESAARRASPQLRADLAMPAPGKSKVVFLRPSHMAYAVHFRVHDGERMIGRSSSRSYFAYECDPGPHVFSTSMDNLAFLNADLLPDRIYYVHVKAVMGVWIAGVKMYPLYPGGGDIKLQDVPGTLLGLERETISPEDVANDARGIEKYMVRLKKYQDNAKGDDKYKIHPEYGQTTSFFSQ